MDGYLVMMKRMAGLYRQYRAQYAEKDPRADDLADLIDGLEDPAFARLMEGLPALMGPPQGAVPRREFELNDLKRLAGTDPRWSRVEALVGELPPALDLTDPAQGERTFQAAEVLEDLYPGEGELEGLELRLIAQAGRFPTILHLAVKLALSRKRLAAIESPPHLTVVAAMYKEHHRIKTKAEHPAGEDFVRRKWQELAWLFRGRPEDSWDLVFVDDGCPEGSCVLAEGIISAEGYPNVGVLRLAEGIEASCPVTQGLCSTDDSQKGGAIQYGMWEAIQRSPDPAGLVVIYTDADLSTNVAQAGLLLEKLEAEKTVCALGSRYDPGGLYCGPEGALGLTDHDLVRLIFRHFVRTRLMPQLGPGVDTQCGFKAVKAEALARVLDRMTDKGFSFDMELLLLVTLLCDRGGETVVQAPVVWVESSAESNFW